MKVNGIIKNNIEELRNIKEARAKKENLKIERASNEEKISNQSEVVEVHSQKIIETVMKKINSMPEIREEKVKEIKEKIQSGNYNISNREIARAMIVNLLNEIA